MAALAESVVLAPLSFAGLPMPVTIRLPEPTSDDELIALSHQNRPFQIERNAQGELEIMSPLGGDGSLWENIVSGELLFWAKVHGGKVFNSNGGFSLPDGSVRIPDAAWVSETQWSTLSKNQRRGFPPLCPEFVVEVLSLSDSSAVLEAKMEMWVTNGAQLAWMIDPYGATVSIYRPGRKVEVLDRPDSVEAGEPVAGFQLSTLLLWDV